jgi:hypothetical protein
MVRNFVGCVRETGYDDHDGQLFASQRLEIRKRRQRREYRNNYCGSPGWEWLQIQRKKFGSITTVNDVLLARKDVMREGPSTDQRDGVSVRSVVRDPGASQRDSRAETGSQRVQLTTSLWIEKEVEIVPDLQSKTL